MTTGERIRESRKAAGLTQTQLSNKLGISPVNISQLENDQRTPNLETLQRIADALDIPLRGLLDLMPDDFHVITYLQEKKGLSNIELSRLTDISLDRLYSITCGKAYPTANEITCLAAALDTPLTVLSRRIPIYNAEEIPNTPTLPPDIQRVAESMELMNDEGREKVVDYASDLEASGKYKKSNPSGMGKKQA